MFFVVSALILVQCAKMFPSRVKSDEYKAPLNKTTYDNFYKDDTADIANYPYKQASLKTDNISPAMNIASLSYSWMVGADKSNKIFNPYISFKNYKLAGNTKWQSN